MKTPIISIEYDMDTETYQLMATSYSVTNPAGPRLFRGGDLPDVQWTHSNEAEALRDCALLQTYVTLAWAGKAPRAKGKEEQDAAPKLSVWDLKNAVWMT